MLDIANALSTLRTASEAPTDARTDAEKAIDRDFGAAAKPEDYLIRYGLPGQELTMTPELKQFDANARGWLSDGGMAVEIGNALVATIDRVAQQTRHMTEGELETYRQTEHRKMQRAHGEQLGDRLRAADDMIDQLEQQRPGLKQLLGSTGIGRSAMVWNILIQQAAVYHARKGR
jgi:hypothetical protein